MFKADIDAAYRRVPVAPGAGFDAMQGLRNFLALSCRGHRVFTTIAYKRKGSIFLSEHAALPFGAVASVQAWDRIGALALPTAAVAA